MSRSNDKLDALRAGCSEIENHYIDELRAGRVSRRDFIRKGSVIGLSLPTLGAVLAACGAANSASSSAAAGPKKRGGTVRIAQQVPTASINPLSIDDIGGLNMLAQVGDFLIRDNLGFKGAPLLPGLALSWRPNADGTEWTFKLRSGVKFHDGSPMTADDVVYTFRQLADPSNASNALSVYKGILSPAGVQKVNSHAVKFHLEAPIGNFPYLVSTDTYNAIIVRNGTDYAKWHKTFLATGPWRMQSYSPNEGASFAANPAYWGQKPLLASTKWTFYSGQAPQILALQGGTVDVVNGFAVGGAQALLHNPQYNIVSFKTAIHNELSMRTDQAPFTDPRFRQAVALTLDRPTIIKALLGGYGVVGNDSPFAPIYPSTNTSVPQRKQDLAKAKQLLADAGHPNGFSTTLFTEQYQELPNLAQTVAADAKKIGIDIKLNVEVESAYYGKSVFGSSDWLDGTMSLVNYAGRGVPNVVLGAVYTTDGVWNAARFHNKQYDGLFKQYVAAVDLQSQRQIAGKIEQLLLAETPVIFSYFNDQLIASKSNVHGVYGSQSQQFFFDRAYVS